MLFRHLTVDTTLIYWISLPIVIADHWRMTIEDLLLLRSSRQNGPRDPAACSWLSTRGVRALAWISWRILRSERKLMTSARATLTLQPSTFPLTCCRAYFRPVTVPELYAAVARTRNNIQPCRLSRCILYAKLVAWILVLLETLYNRP